MVYLDEGHKKRFQDLMAEDHAGASDRERKSLFYIISGSSDLYQKKHLLYDSREHCIIPVLTRKKKGIDLSSGARALVQLGFNLYNGMNRDANVCDIFWHLDERNKILALNAIKIRFM